MTEPTDAELGKLAEEAGRKDMSRRARERRDKRAPIAPQSPAA